MSKLIKVDKISGDEIVINADLIETIKATPDTVVTLTTNKKLLVQNDVDEIIDKVISYQQEISSNLRIEKG